MPLLSDLRRDYHHRLCSGILGHRTGEEALTIADKHSQLSVEIAQGIADRLGFTLTKKPRKGQTAGKLFTQYTSEFLEAAFARLRHVRPGNWFWSTSQKKLGIAAYDQYSHLAQLQETLENNPELMAALGGDYLITPDIIVAREPLSDDEVNSEDELIGPGDVLASHSPLRRSNRAPVLQMLHASISCKWTIRSDRAQNTRSEALNLIRNRKGNIPHIVLVTMEPLPSRLASIVLGTGDLDCSYHSALYELRKSVEATGRSDLVEQLEAMVEGRRLRDISDLPLDLAI